MHKNKKNLLGKHFGRLTVLEEAGSHNKRALWKCSCHCGNFVICKGKYLLNGDTKSCGCLKLDKLKERSFKGFYDIGMDYWSSVQRGAVERNIEFNISIEFAYILYLKQEKKCALTKLPISFVDGTASLDRIDSSLGYVIGNLQWLHKNINVSKNKYKEEHYVDLCNKVANFSGLLKPILSQESNLTIVDEKWKTLSNKRWKGHGNISLDFFTTIKKAAISRNIKFDISIEGCWNLYLNQGGKCALSGLDIQFQRSKRQKIEQTASLDRIDSFGDYTYDNIQWVHKNINIMKWIFGQDEFVQYCKLVNKNRNEPKFPLKVIALSGGADCVHVGHLRMCEDAHNHADIVVWILNNDNWLVKKKNYAFIDEQSRLEIMRAFRAIDVCFLTSHQENCQDMSVCAELTLIQPDIFANGGDRKSDNIPEYVLCDNLGIEMMFGVGGEKIQSSSDLVRNAISKMSI